MNAAEYRALMTFDQSLTVGQHVMISWTNCYRSYSVPATVTKINAKSVLASIHEVITSTTSGLAGPDGVVYPQHHVIKVPRITDSNGWTANNCVMPPAPLKPRVRIPAVARCLE